MTTPSSAARAHARAHAANVVGRRLPEGALDSEAEARIFREIARVPEVESGVRDQWGNWDFAYGESNLRGQLYTPWLDAPLAAERTRLAASSAALEPLWPGGAPFALCLTHDVDIITTRPRLGEALRMFTRDASLMARHRKDRAAKLVGLRSLASTGTYLASTRWRKPARERSYDEWIKLEDRHGFRSTFLYFPERVSEATVYDSLFSYADRTVFDGRTMTVREMMRAIATAGWEIGLHGSYHSATRPGLLAEQKRQVEDALGASVISTRQHWLHYEIGTTPSIQESAGLLVDSTQGFNRNVGFRAGTSFPYWVWDFEHDRATGVLEIPQHVMDGGLFTNNALECDSELAARVCLHLMDEVAKVGGCLCLNWHPNSIQSPEFWEVYVQVLAEASRRGAWGCSMGQLHDWWSVRAARIAATD